MKYPQVIDEYIRKTMEDNFKCLRNIRTTCSTAPMVPFHAGIFPADFARVKKYVDEGRWFPAGSSMEEGDVNAPSAETISITGFGENCR